MRRCLSVSLFVLLGLTILILPAFSSTESNITIYIIGDSTVCNYSSEYFPRAGWGQLFGNFFNGDVIIENKAYSGRSSKSFWDEGLFAEFSDNMKEGDYLFIQFGHNDEKSEDPARYTDPDTTFKEYLYKYITVAWNQGVNPVLCTPVNRRRFDSDGNLVLTHGEYPAAMIELGESTNVPVIDLTAKSKILFEEYGVEGTKDLFLILAPGISNNYPDGVEDNTHFQINGAKEISKLVVSGIEELNLPLIYYLK